MNGGRTARQGMKANHGGAEGSRDQDDLGVAKGNKYGKGDDLTNGHDR